jgi:hypothetical protein
VHMVDTREVHRADFSGRAYLHARPSRSEAARSWALERLKRGRTEQRCRRVTHEFLQRDLNVGSEVGQPCDPLMNIPKRTRLKIKTGQAIRGEGRALASCSATSHAPIPRHAPRFKLPVNPPQIAPRPRLIPSHLARAVTKKAQNC